MREVAAFLFVEAEEEFCVLRIRPDPDGDEAARDAYLAEARWRIQQFMVAAGLTELQRRVYWLRVGDLMTWREIARELWPTGRNRRHVLMPQACVHYARAEARLARLVRALGLRESPLYGKARGGDEMGAREDALHALGTLILQAGAEPPNPKDDPEASHPFAKEWPDELQVRRLCRTSGADFREVMDCIRGAVARYASAWAKYRESVSRMDSGVPV